MFLTFVSSTGDETKFGSGQAAVNQEQIDHSPGSNHGSPRELSGVSSFKVS